MGPTSSAWGSPVPGSEFGGPTELIPSHSPLPPLMCPLVHSSVLSGHEDLLVSLGHL